MKRPHREKSLWGLFVRFSVIFERSEEIKKTTCYAGGGELALASSRKPPMI